MRKYCNYSGAYRGILEKKLGRKLEPNEEAHHVNGCKKDDRPENLIALTRKEHKALHAKPVVKRSKRCLVCGNIKYGSTFIHVRVQKPLAIRLAKIASLNHRHGIQTDAELAVEEYCQRHEVLTNKRDNGK